MERLIHAEIERHLREIPAAPQRVLDWGCGYGRGLLRLLELGYDAHGVDISAEEVARAAESLNEVGADTSRLQVLDQDGHAPYTDGEFDYICSSEVFEHVRDLDQTVAEIARVLAPGGTSLHTFPAKYLVVEPHLGVPFVHWLPKNAMRLAALHAFSAIGVRAPQPQEIPHANNADTLRFQYDYLCEQTFYRLPGTVVAVMRRHGLNARVATANHRKLTRVPQPLRQAAGAVVALTRTTVIEATKPGVAATHVA